MQGQLVDIITRRIYPANIAVKGGKIEKIRELTQAPQRFILPGFIDAHIHIESSMLAPSAFAQIAVTHGTVATVSDPHEIANVCGTEGIDFMIRDAARSPLKFNFGAPSCVPATSFETAGHTISSTDITALLARTDIKYLAEMMNFPGVLHQDKEVMAKIKAAKHAKKPIDGHAPGLLDGDAAAYASAGISTDHECVSLKEALDKINADMYILIREGSAAKNFDTLVELFQTHPGKLMFCSDDKHPDELLKGHINQLVQRAIAKGYNLFDVLHAACVLPVEHYNLDVGLLRKGDPADFIIVENLRDFKILETYIDGKLVARDGQSLLERPTIKPINNFKAEARQVSDFKINANYDQGIARLKVIGALDGQLITTTLERQLKPTDGELLPDMEQDILKIGVINRYEENASPSIGFVHNFGLKSGAIASSIAHDSHNIIFVGCDDHSICNAVNAIIRNKGGISVCDKEETQVMPLPIAGLMTDKGAAEAATAYERLDAAAKKLGSNLSSPFMTLSFMALPVIPELKITDKGLFDVKSFAFTDLMG